MTSSTRTTPQSITHDQFIAVINQQYNTVYLTALAVNRDSETSADITQETFLRAWLNLQTLTSSTQLTPWLHAIARNIARQWKRDGLNRSRLLPLIPLEDMPMDPADPHQPSPRDHAITREETRLLHEILETLPEEMRAVILYHYVDGMTATQIASITSESISTITRRLEKSRELLRDKMESRLEPAFTSLRPPTRIAVRAGLIITAISALPPTTQAQLLSLAASTPLPAAITTAASSIAIGSSVTTSSAKLTILSQITQGITMTTLTKIIAGLVITTNAILAIRSITSDTSRSRETTVDSTDLSPAFAPEAKVITASKKRSASDSDGKDDPSSTRTRPRLDPRQRMTTWKDDIVSSNPQLIVRDGETTGRIYFNVLVVNESGLPVSNAKVEMYGLGWEGSSGLLAQSRAVR